MGRPPTNFNPPSWFKSSNYNAMAQMDAADWYINLYLRLKKNIDLQGKIESGKPLLLRRNLHAVTRLVLLWNGALNGDVRKLIDGEEVTLGVESLRCEEMYLFERMLPDDIRSFGATFDVEKHTVHDAPKGFTSELDHLFTPRKLGAFARVNLALPDDVLMDSFRAFLSRKRDELSALGGSQPYKDALETTEGTHAVRLGNWWRLLLLPCIDIDAWAERNAQKRPTHAAMARLFNLSEDDVKQARNRAQALSSEFYLNATLLAEASAANRA